MPRLTRRELCLYLSAVTATHAIPSKELFAAGDGDENPLTRLSLTEASRQLHAGEVTSTQLTEACLQQISLHNPHLNAIITVMRDEAIAEAHALDAEAATGRLRSPLHGIPLALKDNIDTAGVPTTAASCLLKRRIPLADAEVVRRLRGSGAVIIGKANMHEFGLGITSASSCFGPVRNPWAPDRVPGGSSGGSAAAVIAELCYAALGTDTGGSVRIPAAWCGVVGLKPTDGLVSNRGIVPCIPSLDTCGPIARCVEDVALLLQQMTGYDSRDPRSVARDRQDYAALMEEPVSRLRIGVPRTGFWSELHPDVAENAERALTVLGELALGVKNVQLPASATSPPASFVYAEIYTQHRRFLEHQADAYQPTTLNTIRDSEEYFSASGAAKIADYVQAAYDLAEGRRSIGAAFNDFDVIVLPTMKTLPPALDNPDSTQISTDNCFTINALGLPAISIPCGFSATGLPVGLMIAGPHFSEGRLLALARAYERATGWGERRPVLPGISSQ